MASGAERLRRSAAAGLLLAVAAGAAWADEAETGRRIYLQGAGRALIANGRVEAPGSRFACVNCHKADGLGVLEGGLKPRDVTWPALTRQRADGGRGYDERSLARAIAEGLDAEGAPLGPGMPRFRLDPAELAAVIAYLRRFEAPAEPGLSGEAIRLATLLPLNGRQADSARAVERFLDLAVLDINTRRRFDGRRLVRISVPFDPDEPGDAERAVQDLLARDPPFAFVSNLAIGPDHPARGLIAAAGVPEIAPVTAPLDAADRTAIWIEPSVADQARTLVETAVRSASMPYASEVAGRPVRLGLLWAATRESETAATAARDEARRLGATLVLERAGFADADAAALGGAAADAVLVFGSAEEASRLLEAAERLPWRPVLLGRSQQMAGLLRDHAAQRRASIFLVTTFGGVDHRSRGSYEFRRVAGELGGGHPELLRDAYVGAKIVEHGVAAAGPALTRARFLATLSATTGFETGVMPPLAFGPDASRRAAALVMWLDPARHRLVPLDSFHPS